MIKAAFDKHKSIFIPFIMAGHPNLATSTKAVMALVGAGADIIELGVPFSDPIADGPVNQRAAELAIENGMNLVEVLAQVKAIRGLGCTTPIILFTYLNPILVCGYNQFCHQAKAAGIDGVLVVDLPPEEGEDFYITLKEAGLEVVLLVSPTTDPVRLPLYAKLQPSFIYYISRLSVTGIQQDLSHTLEREVNDLRNVMPNTKMAVGFGISSIEQAKYVSHIADGVIIGSKLVSTLETFGIAAFEDKAKEFADIIHGGNL
ncbi:tryptophan synthase subunit alpha [Rickettsiales endosymbiont of Peranema trichophorum]|uniref:tryptophan synthase subunit alpha n=1 Tax=Rickettsiales endosymbiont of Peranema trichophorum TaxID=2486577 RepID=UPI001022E237|nr:tryptophan synthase subunit alpha [Rickettsiales endosymbiont of Peranema trichophorum]RZI47638.1 tryptophan synthase subunit alpha [Rickettsiales endosymbiont of Peranema trichophorum]